MRDGERADDGVERTVGKGEREDVADDGLSRSVTRVSKHVGRHVEGNRQRVSLRKRATHGAGPGPGVKNQGIAQLQLAGLNDADCEAVVEQGSSAGPRSAPTVV